MFGKNRQINLFREIRIENFIAEKEREIINKIGRYSDSTLASLDIENEIINLIRESRLQVPKLIKVQTKTSITSEQVTGQQLTPGTRYHRGKRYDIEIANYNIPFNGNREFFKCHPSIDIGVPNLEVELGQDSITIKLTNWLGGISGKDEIIEKLKNELVGYVESIEQVLKQIQNDIDEYLPILEDRLRTELNSLIKKVNIKKESNDKLNPFG